MPLFAAVLLEQIDLLLHGEAVDIDAEFFEFLVKVFGTRVPLVLPHGAEAAVRRFVVLRRAFAHAKVEDALEVVDLLRLFDEAVARQVFAGDRLKDVKVVLEVLRYAGRLDTLVFHAVVGGFDVVPRQLTEALQREPETEVREEEERLRLIFVCRELLVDHVHEDEPRLVVLRSLEGEEVAAPLGDRFLAAVLGGLKSLADHADLHHFFHVRAVMLGEVFTRHLDALAAGDREFVFAVGDAVDELHDVGLLSEVEVQAVRMFFVDQPQLEAFADKGDAGAEGDGVKAVVVGVEVGLDRPERIEDAEVGAESRRGLIFGAVDDDLFALPGAGLEREVVNRLRAGERAAVPAAVRHSLREELYVGFGADVVDILVAAELVVVDRQQRVVVHDLGKVGRTGGTHLALFVVKVVDTLVEACSGALDRLDVHGIVFQPREVRALHDERDDALVVENRTAAAAPGLLQAHGLAAHVVEAEVHAGPVACARADAA